MRLTVHFVAPLSTICLLAQFTYAKGLTFWPALSDTSYEMHGMAPTTNSTRNPRSTTASKAETINAIVEVPGEDDSAEASSTYSIGASVVHNAASDFEKGWVARMNPNGVWSYGYSSGPAKHVTLYNKTVQNGVNGPHAQYWLSPSVDIGTSPAAEYNDGPAYDDGNVDFLSRELVLVAGVGGQFSNLVFTAPADGKYSVMASFRGDQRGVGSKVGVAANGKVLFKGKVTAERQIVSFNVKVGLKAGETIDFSVGPGGGTQNTGLSVGITGP
jgi:hypothetical protein